MSENEDDWFYDSITRYKNLSMFELEYPVHQMEPASNDSICVSCSDKKQHQLLELVLPLKLTSQERKLTNDTDLKIRCGTFTPSRVDQMKACTSDHTVVASHEKMDGVILYELSTDNSDQIEKSSTISCELECPFIALNESQIVLTKTSAASIFIIDKKTGDTISKTLYSKVEPREELVPVSPVFIDSTVVAVCNHFSGTVQLYDTRGDNIVSTSMDAGEKNNIWSFSSSYESSCNSENSFVAMVSNRGNLKVYDTRNWKEPYLNSNLEVKPHDSSSVQVRFKPSNKDVLSVSGFDGNVYVYKLEAEPRVVFMHDGHRHVEGFTSETVTSSHLWFHGIDNLIISSAYNGTVQLWQFEDQVKSPATTL